MADTEFSGDLMGLKSGIFNPHYSYKTSFMTNDVFPAPSDRGLVDYLVHGKDTMIQTYDATIGDLPLLEKKEKEPVKVILNPKWYSEEKWNEIQTAHRVPATCSIPYRPEYTIIHTAPYPIKPVESPYPLNDEHKLVVTPVPTSVSTPTPRGIEYPDSMIDAVPYTVKMVTSKVITKIEKFQGEAYVSKHTHSAYYNKTPGQLINAKLDLVDKMIGHCKRGNERRHHCPGWQCNIVAGGMSHTLSRPDMSYTDFIKFYHAQYTDSCRPHGRLSDEDYETLEFDEFAFDYIPDKIRYEDTDELDNSENDVHFTLPKLSEPDDEIEYEVPYFTVGGPTKMVDKEVKYRAGHWLDSDVVELQKPQIRMRYSPFYVERKPFFRRTRLRSRRGGYLTVRQWEALFGLEDVPEAVKTAPSGIHPLAPLLGRKRVSARFVDGLRFFGYTVELRRVGDSHRDVQCLIVP